MMESTERRPSSDYTEIISRLPLKHRLAYGVGHVLNDICASMWFTYLLVFFHLVLQFNSFLAGLVLLIGQIADAVATPFVGYQSDRDDNFWLCKYGRRKTWHLFGTVCVLFSFPLIFSPCLNCEHSHQWAQLIYYSAFVIIFQLGWASVQISHLSLIPDLTPSEHERTELTAIRYSFTVCSNVFVYIITWAILHFTSENSEAQIGPKDLTKFQNVSLIGIGVGAFASLIFHLGVKEAPPRSDGLMHGPGGRRTALHMLKDIQLYQVAGVYMATRLFVNLSQVYIPLYLHESLSMNAESLAIVPLVMLLSSFGTSLLIKLLNKKLGRKVAYLVGAAVGFAGCLWIQFGYGSAFVRYEIYGVAVLLGAGGSIMLVTSLGITADFIGHNTESGAFVYGAMSFTDKLSNGVAVTIIQTLKCGALCVGYYRDVMTYVCGGAALFGVVALVTLMPFQIGRRKDGAAPPYRSLTSEEQTDGFVNASIQNENQAGLIS
ncbi:major facilitator superfamily domain-containing protein 12-like [Schistocerca gregaria]|uniref:major facilitator superfamily domain-containing protein 12-like n=1 Tax=Schistocerca gregaria TaxID=7010 RepID=UPI00211EF718|nr:major facilitator superfamily domain-containing protein 12-like [Schistocerca gregaria]XP_049827166.1 major facilitator superfamily domain-containing protein 12-like [Schistocerca gregaria]XP_049827167.1 major facilitator superfamily domain-containing protein 12-like [Schistocerca gregaria]XP_049827168.1 major facilitator superfamily domain-containing protein 12-like [Schistocerca gregaria]XP_049827169.1 major facilitator superfamily domain-containing protein 12-like [Schistocerca gregaria]